MIEHEPDLRSLIISIGLPIVVPGPRFYRGAKVAVSYEPGQDVERTVTRGWVDLREENCRLWIGRAQRMVERARTTTVGTGSDADWYIIDPDDEIEPARFATWIFRFEEGGERIKR